MSDTLTVRVTQEHIDAGVRRDCGRCPLALALEGGRRAGAKERPAWVENSVVKDAQARLWRLSQPARRFVADFDAGRPVRPATFRLRSIW